VQNKKDMIAIALAHKLKYVAQTTVGYLADIQAKVKKAAAADGPAYIQILVPCIPGWGIKPDMAMQAGKLAAQTGLYPCIEYVNGELTGKMKVPVETPKVDEYLKMQSRFSHLFKSPLGKEYLELTQKSADENIVKYGLK
jgi:pyruvate ferredoxin oxidoreductase beta subunit